MDYQLSLIPTTTNIDGSSTTLIPCLVTADEKTQKKNDVKARNLVASEYYKTIGYPWNKPDLDTMSFDDLYNNFKIVEQEVKGTASSSLSLISPASTQVSTASTQVSIANLSGDTVYAFLASQLNGSQLVHDDLEQIHEDDLEDIDLKWQLALLSMSIRRGPNNQDSRNWNQDSSRRTINVEETSSKAMLSIDGAGFDWSYMADDEVSTNMALMAFSDSEVHNDKTCSKTCLKSFETLNTQLDDLRIEFKKSEFNLATYKRGLAFAEEQLVFYKKNKVLFCEQLAILKRDISYKDSEISVLKSELEKLRQEKESNQLKIENFDNAFKSLDKLIGSQITDKSRKGVGFVSYNVVPPPPTRLFSPPNLNLSNSGLEEFQQPEFEGYGPKTSKSVSEDTSNEVREYLDASLVEELVSNDKLEKKTVFLTVAKINFANCNYHQRDRMVSGNNYTRVNYNYSDKKAHPSAHRNIVPRAVLIKTALRPLNTARPVNTAHPKTTVNSARPMPKAVNTTRPNTTVVNAVRANQVNAVKASACWATCPISQTSKNLMEDMLHLGEEPKEEELLMCDKKNSVLFINTGCFVLSPDFKLADKSQVLLKVPRKNNMYSVDMKNIVPKESLTCLVAKATLDESMLWHRRLENLVDKKVKIIRCDNGTEFKNRFMNEFCEKKGIKREFSVARTPQQNGVVNMVLVVKPHNKTPYELLEASLIESLMMDSCWILMNSKGFRVYNIRTRKVEENLHVRFLEDKPIIAGGGRCHSNKEPGSSQDYILMPLWKDGSLFDSSLKNTSNDEPQPSNNARKKDDESRIDQEKTKDSTQDVNTFPNCAPLHMKSTYAYFFGDESELDLSNIATTYPVPSTPNTRIHKDHSLDHVIGDVQFGVRTMRMTNEQGFISTVYEGKTHEDLHTCLFSHFLSQEEPKKVIQALKYPSWIEAMQEELL
ncbi:putative ribonuclease H-like domain-containing protein [Tanacetum coccineum]|uniref:Ribonuclease H-like domain-containing protein n=1 Tax=Tanacetum coccineum TaxID=301880 RepID=A0ABQ5IL31_9ASTR